MLTVVADATATPATVAAGASSVSPIDEIVREGARRMLAAAFEAEVAANIDAHTDQLDEDGHRLVVRNGHAVPRQVVTSAGAVPGPCAAGQRQVHRTLNPPLGGALPDHSRQVRHLFQRRAIGSRDRSTTLADQSHNPSFVQMLHWFRQTSRNRTMLVRR